LRKLNQSRIGVVLMTSCPLVPLGPPACRPGWRGGRWLRQLIGWTMLVGVGVAGAAEYHVALEGDDAHAGTAAQPWRTLAKVNATLAPGDTAWFQPGEYEGEIAPARSGAPGAPIIYRSARRLGAVITGEPSQGEGSSCVRLEDREHVTIEGFALRPAAGRLM